MRKLLVVLSLLALGCGVQEEPVATTESAVVSTDPCGVTISPYNPACTKRATWTCAQYNSTTHRCQRARGTQKTAGMYWLFKADPDRPAMPNGSIAFYPAWGGDLSDDSAGVSDAQVAPRGFAMPYWQPLLSAGWSYSTNDLTPCCISGLQTMSWEYVEFYNGAAGCLYTGSGYTGLLGCWQSNGTVLRVETNQLSNPPPVIRSFFTY